MASFEGVLNFRDVGRTVNQFAGSRLVHGDGEPYHPTAHQSTDAKARIRCSSECCRIKELTGGDFIAQFHERRTTVSFCKIR